MQSGAMIRAPPCDLQGFQLAFQWLPSKGRHRPGVASPGPGELQGVLAFVVTQQLITLCMVCERRKVYWLRFE